jgi:hypothetical protein
MASYLIRKPTYIERLNDRDLARLDDLREITDFVWDPRGPVDLIDNIIFEDTQADDLEVEVELYDDVEFDDDDDDVEHVEADQIDLKISLTTNHNNNSDSVV